MSEAINFIQKLNLDHYYILAGNGVMMYIPKIIGAILILWIGFKVVGILRALTMKIMSKRKMDSMLKSFLLSLMTGLLKILVFITAAGVLGVETSSFVALLAAAGLAIGMALSGTLQNFAGGVIILLFKPFKAGNYVEVSGHIGYIEKIEIFNTIIHSTDKKTIIIPNADIINTSIINYSDQPIRRVDITVGIAYTDSISKAKEVLVKIAENDEDVLQDQKTMIGVRELGDNSVILVFRPYVKSEDYWKAFYRLNETIKNEFDANGLNFPFPQRDVHIYNEK